MGSNRRAAELAGLHVNRIRIGVLTFNGLASALGALLAVSQAQTADPNLGTGYELDVIAAVIIGGAKLTGGSGTVLASVLGLLLIKMIQNGLVIAGVSIYLARRGQRARRDRGGRHRPVLHPQAGGNRPWVTDVSIDQCTCTSPDKSLERREMSSVNKPRLGLLRLGSGSRRAGSARRARDDGERTARGPSSEEPRPRTSASP